MLCIVVCPDPDCAAPAEVADRFTLSSTHGPVEHVKTCCVHRHRFLLPSDLITTRPTSAAAPAGTSRTPSGNRH